VSERRPPHRLRMPLEFARGDRLDPPQDQFGVGLADGEGEHAILIGKEWQGFVTRRQKR